MKSGVVISFRFPVTRYSALMSLVLFKTKVRFLDCEVPKSGSGIAFWTPKPPRTPAESAPCARPPGLLRPSCFITVYDMFYGYGKVVSLYIAAYSLGKYRSCIHIVVFYSLYAFSSYRKGTNGVGTNGVTQFYFFAGRPP